eukprot:6173433-Pleurochrysis_carterae.AAC.2
MATRAEWTTDITYGATPARRRRRGAHARHWQILKTIYSGRALVRFALATSCSLCWDGSGH